MIKYSTTDELEIVLDIHQDGKWIVVKRTANDEVYRVYINDGMKGYVYTIIAPDAQKAAKLALERMKE